MLSSPRRATHAMPSTKNGLETVAKLIKATGIQDLAATVGWLQEYQLPATNVEAESYLEFWRSVLTLRALYATTFPQDFARSKKSFIPGRHAAYSRQEQEFFTLVDRRRVPLSWWIFDASEREERQYGMPVMVEGLDWWDEDASDWKLGWQLLLWLLGEMDAQEILAGGRYSSYRKTPPEVDPALFETPVVQGELDLQALEARCREIKGPLRYLPQALRMLFHNTGTEILDNTPDMDVGLVEWSAESLALFAEDHRQAREINEQADSLVEWIGDDPSTRFKEVITLWNSYTKEKPQQQKLME
jgi:hypothetical protein